MKRYTNKCRLASVVTVGLAVCLLLCACTGPTLVDSSTGCVDERSGITYVHASPCYEPVALGDQHGSLKIGDKMTYALHEIDGMDPSRWLATEVGDVLYAKDELLPTLTQMEPVALHICMDANTVVELDCIEDVDTVRSVARQYEEGVPVTRPSEKAPEQYTVRFESTAYAGLYYTLTYLEYVTPVEEKGVNYGTYFLFDRMSGRLVAVDDSIHNAVNGIAPESTASDSTETAAPTP